MKTIACPKCPSPLDPAAGPHHPYHDFTPDELKVIERYETSKAAEDREAGKAQAQMSKPEHHAEAVRMIHQFALTNSTLSANDLRRDMDKAGIDPAVRGGAWSSAVRAGYIAAEVYETSTGRSAHSKPVTRYVSQIFAGKAR